MTDLVDQANKNGGVDNITVIVMRTYEDDQYAKGRCASTTRRTSPSRLSSTARPRRRLQFPQPESLRHRA